MSPSEFVSTMSRLDRDEREIVTTLIQRIDDGRSAYGPWEIGQDRRDYRREALEEVLDSMNYVAAELVRLQREHRSRLPRVYVCHAYSNDPAGNAEDIAAICRELASKGVLPIAPQIYIPRFVDEATDRERALKLCLELLADCDVVFQFGSPSDGMRRELEFARERSIPVRQMDQTEVS